MKFSVSQVYRQSKLAHRLHRHSLGTQLYYLDDFDKSLCKDVKMNMRRYYVRLVQEAVAESLCKDVQIKTR